MENAILRRKSIPPGYLFKAPTHWRMRAEKMRTLAEEANDPAVRAMMLRFAANYDRIAGQAADSAPQDSIMFRREDVKPEYALDPDALIAVKIKRRRSACFIFLTRGFSAALNWPR